MHQRLRGSILVFAVLVAQVVAAPANAEPTTFHFDDVSETFLTTQYRSRGISFPQTVEVKTCSSDTCIGARSGAKVARSLDQNELVRQPFVAAFETPQDEVTLHIRNDVVRSGVKELRVVIDGFEASGVHAAQYNTIVRSDSGWQPLTLFGLFGRTFSSVRVQLREETSDVFDNGFAVDDITFEPPSSPPSPPPSNPPTVSITSPPGGYRAVTRTVDMGVRAQATGSLNTVQIEIWDVSVRDDLVRTVDFCGSAAAGPCTNPFARTMSVPMVDESGVPLRNGPYELIATACSTTCMSSPRRHFTLEVPPAPAEIDVFASAMEINQGASRTPRAIGLGGSSSNCCSDQLLVSGKDTLVRYYVFARGATAPGYVGRLSVRFHYADGRVVGPVFVEPNAGVSSITPPVDPGADARPAKRREMQMDFTTTLNFVIPGSQLTGVDRLSLTPFGDDLPIGERTEVTLLPPGSVGLNLISIDTEDNPNLVPTATDAQNVILPYLEDTWPIDRARIVSSRSIRTSFGVMGFVGAECADLLHEIWWDFGGDDAPARGTELVTPTLGLLERNAVNDASGCAYVGDASDPDVRVGGSAVTENWGDVAAQELAHVLGLIHASDDHGESDGGTADTGYPHPHGGVGATVGNVGMVARMSPIGASGPFGNWSVDLVDPCPGVDGSTCETPSSAHRHDFMSYGSSAGVPGHTTLAGSWVSDHTQRQLYDTIVHGRDLGNGGITLDGRGRGGERRDAFIVGISLHHGNISATPLGRKALPSSVLDQPTTGPVRVDLVGAGRIVATRSFTPVEMTHHRGQVGYVQAVLPYVEGVTELRVSAPDAPALVRKASAHAPSVRLLTPNGGEIVDSRPHVVRWEGSDADGDELYYLVQYTPDGGRSWQGIETVGPGEPLELTLNPADYIAGNKAKIRVMATDGINTAVDESDCGLSVGTSQSPECHAPLDIKPAACPNVLNPNSKGVLPTALVGSRDLDASKIDPASVELEGVAPLRSTIEDAATPFAPNVGKDSPDDCTAAGADGRPDLALKFDTERVMAAIGPVDHGEVRVLHLTARLKSELGGAPITAEDVVVFVRPTKVFRP